MPAKTHHRFHAAVLVVWIVGFLIGTATHVLDLLAGGFDTYAEVPTAVRLFWVSLTILDPITILLLALRRPAGIILALVVILADIAVNWTVFVTLAGSPLFAVVSQTLFAVVLLTTAPLLWRWFRTRSQATAAPPFPGTRADETRLDGVSSGSSGALPDANSA